MPSFQEEENFGRTVFAGILDQVIDWIYTNMSPEDVFGDDVLFQWAEGQSVEDLCSECDLEDWALGNGFIKEEE